jgi:spermidine synthase
MGWKNIKPDKSVILKTFYLLFAFSGFSGLIYESVWTHYLKLFLGSAAYAQTLVLVIFMGGMAVGAWGVGRVTTKIRNLFYAYAIVELVIGVFALIFHNLFVNVTNFSYNSVIPNIDSTAFLVFYKWTLAAILILPQTILLGATFPLMSAGLIRIIAEKPGRTIAFLYFSNSIGAVAGVLVSGYLLIDFVGLPGTILAAGLINILIALIVWLMCSNENTDNVPTSAFNQQHTILSKKIIVILLLSSCLTGASSFMYEIGWIRMLCLVLGSTTHAFELMLSAFILGLAIGGYWIKRSIDSLADPLKSLGIIQLIMGGFALCTLLLYGQTFNVMSYILAALSKTQQAYFLFNLFSQGLSMLIMLPATICAGMTLPIITYYLISKGYGEGAIGKTYASNTIGGIVGVLLAVQVIMPLLGVKSVIIIGAIIDVMLGLFLLWHVGSKSGRRRWIAMVVFFSGLFLVFIFLVHLDVDKMASGVFRSGKAISNTKRIFHEDGKNASVDVRQTLDGSQITISTNGKADGSIGIKKNASSPDETTQTILGALPWGMNENAKTVAIIGMGTGMTGHVLLSVPTLESVDTIEIEPAMVKGARFFGDAVANIFKDSRSHIYIEDAKTFFTNNKKKYDLIISEPSNPWVSGVAGLFSREFYSLIRGYINDDGLFVQWLQLYEISTPLAASVMKAVGENFEDYDIYLMNNSDLLIVAGKNLQNRKPGENMFKMPALKAELARIGIYNTQDFLIRYLGNKRIFDPLFQSYEIPPNSDFYPILDLNAVRDRFMKLSAGELNNIRSVAIPLMEVLKVEKTPVQTFPITQSDQIDAARKARQALAIYEYFNNSNINQKNNLLTMDKTSTQIVRNIRTLRNQCQVDQLVNGWLPYLHSLAQATIPYLSQKQMAVIWKDIESSSCHALLPDPINKWINVYKAFSHRDYEKSLRYSLQLLPEGKIKASSENNYLLFVAMISDIALKNNTGARDLYNRYENMTNPPIEIRLLYAIASKGTN